MGVDRKSERRELRVRTAPSVVSPCGWRAPHACTRGARRSETGQSPVSELQPGL